MLQKKERENYNDCLYTCLTFWTITLSSYSMYLRKRQQCQRQPDDTRWHKLYRCCHHYRQHSWQYIRYLYSRKCCHINTHYNVLLWHYCFVMTLLCCCDNIVLLWHYCVVVTLLCCCYDIIVLLLWHDFVVVCCCFLPEHVPGGPPVKRYPGSHCVHWSASPLTHTAQLSAHPTIIMYCINSLSHTHPPPPPSPSPHSPTNVII